MYIIHTQIYTWAIASLQWKHGLGKGNTNRMWTLGINLANTQKTLTN